MNFQDISGLPLRNIVKFLDVESCKNLLIATEKTEMGLELKNMTREEQYACPVCVIDKLTDNAEEVFKQQPVIPTERRMIQMDVFAFFFQFLVTDRGCSNFAHHIICIDEDDAPISQLVRKETTHSVFYTGCYDYQAPFDDWLSMIDEMKKKKIGKNSVFIQELTRMQRMLFGGSFDGVTIAPTLKLYTRRELERHICRGHNLDDSNDLNLREFWIWTSEWGSQRTFQIPTMWYNPEREINMLSLNEVIKRYATATYYNFKKKSEKNHFARQLLSKELHLLHEALEIFRFAYEAFDNIRFPVQFGPWRELRLLTYYNLIYLTLEALIE